jgi:hypothetical protein
MFEQYRVAAATITTTTITSLSFLRVSLGFIQLFSTEDNYSLRLFLLVKLSLFDP